MTLHREPVTPDKRRAMTPARKRRIWTAWEGKCWFCRQPVEVEGPTVIYDHVGTLWIKGSDADDDIGPIHAAPCNKIKTAADLKKIAKIKRIIAREDGTRRERPPIPSRPFGDQHRSMSHPTLKRTMSGKVVSREDVR